MWDKENFYNDFISGFIPLLLLVSMFIYYLVPRFFKLNDLKMEKMETVLTDEEVYRMWESVESLYDVYKTHVPNAYIPFEKPEYFSDVFTDKDVFKEYYQAGALGQDSIYDIYQALISIRNEKKYPIG